MKPAWVPRPWRFLAVFALLAAVISSVGWWAYRTETAYLRERENRELQAIANFKGKQIEDWLAERRHDAASVVGSAYIRDDFRRWLDGRDDRSGRRLQARLDSLRVYDSYVIIDLLDRQGISRLAAASSHRKPSVSPGLLADIGSGAEPRLIDLERDQDYIHFCYIAPLSDDRKAQVIGYLRLCIDPRRHLFPLIEGWPTPSRTAETLMVRREGNDVLFLNDLRHREGTAFDFRLPVGQESLPAAQAVLGREGVFEGADYRGVPVLSYLRPVAGTPWRMVTKVDQAEVFRNIAWLAQVSIFSVAAAIAVSALVLWLFWRQQELQAGLAAAQALRRRNEELEAFMAAVPAPVLLAEDPDCRRIVGNRAANELFGVEEGANVSLSAPEAPPYRAYGPDGRELRPEELPMQRTTASGQPMTGQECRLLFPDGRTVWLFGNAVPLFDEQGQVRGCVGSYADITTVKAAEQSLRRSQAALLQAGQMARLGAWSVDMVSSEDFRLNPVSWSDETYRLFGFSPGAVEPSIDLFVSLIHPEDRSLAIHEWNRALAERRALDCECRIRRPDGSERIVHGRAEFGFDDQGRATHCYGAVQDITERKQLEIAREAYKDRLEAEVTARTAELLAVNKELQAFTYAASHDLKSPLRGIHSFCTLLERNYRHQLEGDGIQFLDFIRRSAERMNHLIDDLLAHARLDQQAPVLRPENLSAAVRAALAERQEDIAEIGAEICLDPVDAWVRAESHGLIQVLRNLLENALKYSAGAKPPTITIGGAAQGDRYRLWIRDNGVGFDMAYHDRIFEIFRRLHSYEEFPGNGVGLALVKKAMERMGGKVWAESTPGNGATFFLEFALSPRKAEMLQAEMC